MAVLRPFKAWRPTPEHVQEIISVPYDVIETDEARKKSLGNDFSFLRVVRPEINLPEITSALITLFRILSLQFTSISFHGRGILKPGYLGVFRWKITTRA